MAISKLILNGTTQMDLTSDTVAAASMLSGTTAHKNDGTSVTGNIASKTSSDVTTSNNVVTIPAGHYASQVQKTVGTTQSATTYNVSTSNQSISSGKYLTGTQTIRGVTTQNISAENIKNGVTIKVGDSANSGRIKDVTGTYSGGASTSVFHFDNSSTSSESLSQYGLTVSDFRNAMGSDHPIIDAHFAFLDNWGMMYKFQRCGLSYGVDTDNYSYYDDLYIIWGSDYIDYYGSTCNLYIKLSSITSSGITIDLQNSKITEADGTVNTLSSLGEFYLEITVAK